MPKRKFKESTEPIDNVDEIERYFLNPTAVSQHLYCSICQDVFFEPQRAPCGHSYCKKCILPWLKQSCTCPEDRKPVQRHQLHHDFILENIIGDQMVACPYRGRGCEFVGQLQLLTTHKKNCDFNPSNLPEFLKEKSKPSTVTNSANHLQDTSLLESSEGKLPTPAKPSLKMRLFRAGADRKQLLCSMFEKNKENTSPGMSHLES